MGNPNLAVLARNVETPHGTYMRGLDVRVVRRFHGKVTIDIAPPGLPSRYLTLNHQLVRRPRRHVRIAGHGSADGWNAHRREGTRPCPACAAWHTDYGRASSIARGVLPTLRIPVPALAALVATADDDATATLADHIGQLSVNALRDAYPVQPAPHNSGRDPIATPTSDQGSSCPTTNSPAPAASTGSSPASTPNNVRAPTATHPPDRPAATSAPGAA